MPTYEELIQNLVDAVNQEGDSKWKQAESMALLVHRHQVKPGQVASEVGCSSEKVRQYVKAAIAFYDPDTRAQDLSMRHHIIAADTEDPEATIQEALEQGWSTRQMTQALKGEGEEQPLKKAQKIFKDLCELVEQDEYPGQWLKEQVHTLALSW